VKIGARVLILRGSFRGLAGTVLAVFVGSVDIEIDGLSLTYSPAELRTLSEVL
jgi:ribosomal protein L24